MKKLILFSLLGFIITATVSGCKQQPEAKSAITLTWHKLTPETCDSKQPLMAVLKGIFIAAYIPLIKTDLYAHDPRLKNIPADFKTATDGKLTEKVMLSLQTGFDSKMSALRKELEDKTVAAAYLAIAKDNKDQAIGFAIFSEKPLKAHLEERLVKIIKEPQEKISLPSIPHSQMRVNLLMVKPDTQKKGVGKALLFSIFEHCSSVTTLYLKTPASETNKNAQAFYEHVGFKALLIGSFSTPHGDKEESKSDFAKKEIVYMYQKQ